MHDGLVAYIREHPLGVDSPTLAAEVLRFKSPDPRVAHTMIAAVLSQDRRCVLGGDGLWRPAKTERAGDSTPLTDVPWAAVFVLLDEAGTRRNALHVSAWSLFETPVALACEWLVDPESLHREERATLTGPFDADYTDRNAAIERLSAALADRALVFQAGLHHTLLSREWLRTGEIPTDDTMLVSQLLKVAGLPAPRPLTLSSCYRTVFEREPVLGTAYRHGECFAEMAWELLRRLIDQGIADRGGLERLEAERTLVAAWTGKAFSLGDISGLPVTPGVYGFTDRTGSYLYIGKAKNLRRRLRTYFRVTDDPSPKLRRLQEESSDLTVHQCGSELESLILEHRLIKKHDPGLNAQVLIGERKGAFEPVPDCVVLLPHAEADKGMSIWLRSDQRALLKPFYSDFRQGEELRKQLDTFFFGPKLTPQRTDFPELEIVHRWVRRHEQDVPLVPVSRLGSGQEVYEWMRELWDEAMRRAPAFGSDK
ncbi:MAG: hypothetical protein GF418_13275 [Chitinivibrionales bacterium]|nr:hypothetical protein [Chitinivibrionales bacterium]MBD3396590.1 hypothetical protein [Chitinivibrionales bacterium]